MMRSKRKAYARLEKLPKRERDVDDWGCTREGARSLLKLSVPVAQEIRGTFIGAGFIAPGWSKAIYELSTRLAIPRTTTNRVANDGVMQRALQMIVHQGFVGFTLAEKAADLLRSNYGHDACERPPPRETLSTLRVQEMLSNPSWR